MLLGCQFFDIGWCYAIHFCLTSYWIARILSIVWNYVMPLCSIISYNMHYISWCVCSPEQYFFELPTYLFVLILWSVFVLLLHKIVQDLFNFVTWLDEVWDNHAALYDSCVIKFLEEYEWKMVQVAILSKAEVRRRAGKPCWSLAWNLLQGLAGSLLRGPKM